MTFPHSGHRSPPKEPRPDTHPARASDPSPAGRPAPLRPSLMVCLSAKNDHADADHRLRVHWFNSGRSLAARLGRRLPAGRASRFGAGLALASAAVVDVLGFERLAALTDEEDNDAERGDRVGPPPAERCVGGEPRQHHGRQVDAGLGLLTVGFDRS